MQYRKTIEHFNQAYVDGLKTLNKEVMLEESIEDLSNVLRLRMSNIKFRIRNSLTLQSYIKYMGISHVNLITCLCKILFITNPEIKNIDLHLENATVTNKSYLITHIKTEKISDNSGVYMQYVNDLIDIFGGQILVGEIVTIKQRIYE
jgi:hypothetical protein